MLTLLFIVLMISFLGEMIGLAIKAAWGITKLILFVIFLPIILVVMALAGLVYIAIPILAVVGLVTLIGSFGE